MGKLPLSMLPLQDQARMRCVCKAFYSWSVQACADSNSLDDASLCPAHDRVHALEWLLASGCQLRSAKMGSEATDPMIRMLLSGCSHTLQVTPHYVAAQLIAMHVTALISPRACARGRLVGSRCRLPARASLDLHSQLWQSQSRTCAHSRSSAVRRSQQMRSKRTYCVSSPRCARST
jgi:hypothetical protein